MFLKRFYFKLVDVRLRFIILVSIIYIFSCAYIITLIEPETFTSLQDGLWWTMTTITTIGYGDISPVTQAGQIFAMLVVDIFGIGLFGTLIGKIAAAFTGHNQRKREGRLMFTGKNHYVIIGWTKTAKLSVNELLSDKKSMKEVVLIGHLDETPIKDDPRFHYVKGSPTEFEVLDQANIKDASAIMIFSPDRIDSADLADGYTLLVATTIERYDHLHEQNIQTIVEIQKVKHQENFRHVKVDQFVLSRQSISKLMLNAAHKVAD